MIIVLAIVLWGFGAGATWIALQELDKKEVISLGHDPEFAAAMIAIFWGIVLPFMAPAVVGMWAMKQVMSTSWPKTKKDIDQVVDDTMKEMEEFLK